MLESSAKFVVIVSQLRTRSVRQLTVWVYISRRKLLISSQDYHSEKSKWMIETLSKIWKRKGPTDSTFMTRNVMSIDWNAEFIFRNPTKTIDNRKSLSIYCRKWGVLVVWWDTMVREKVIVNSRYHFCSISSSLDVLNISARSLLVGLSSFFLCLSLICWIDLQRWIPVILNCLYTLSI